MNETKILPITLSPEEYDGLMGMLAQRDPIMSALMAKQAAAQQAALVQPLRAELNQLRSEVDAEIGRAALKSMPLDGADKQKIVA